jgi:hypothetical protein
MAGAGVATGRLLLRSNGLGEVDGVAIGIGDVRNSLPPWHVVRLAAHAPAQGLHPLQQAIDFVDRDAEKNPARSTGSALGVGDEAQLRVTDLDADIKAGPSSGTRDVWVAPSNSV